MLINVHMFWLTSYILIKSNSAGHQWIWQLNKLKRVGQIEYLTNSFDYFLSWDVLNLIWVFNTFTTILLKFKTFLNLIKIIFMVPISFQSHYGVPFLKARVKDFVEYTVNSDFLHNLISTSYLL